LAKRYFDQAGEYDVEARMPRSVALALMEGQRSLYNWLGSTVAMDVVGISHSAVRYLVEALTIMRLQSQSYFEDYYSAGSGESAGSSSSMPILSKLIRRFWPQHDTESSESEYKFGFGIGPRYTDFYYTNVAEIISPFAKCRAKLERGEEAADNYSEAPTRSPSLSYLDNPYTTTVNSSKKGGEKGGIDSGSPGLLMRVVELFEKLRDYVGQNLSSFVYAVSDKSKPVSNRLVNWTITHLNFCLFMNGFFFVLVHFLRGCYRRAYELDADINNGFNRAFLVQARRR
jgi:hypothetical protein